VYADMKAAEETIPKKGWRKRRKEIFKKTW
jgi:hypothetical protein